MNRSLTDRDLAYDHIATEWRQFIDNFDTNRRAEVLLDEFLADRVAGRSVLDAGCGLGDLSRRLAALKPARHVAIDIAPALVEQLRSSLPNVDARVGDLLNLEPTLAGEQFDVVFSSEVIEHTPNPLLAIRNLSARVAPGGVLALSCPNAFWKWSLHIAEALRVRKKYLGYENWLWASRLRSEVEQSGLTIIRAEGIHLAPWQVVPKGILRQLDKSLRNCSFGWSVNHAILATRR
jgi:2-polyprenyl-3-methyl-5-hydroxy-6-metoxy-1,4-benzoquinol methylase